MIAICGYFMIVFGVSGEMGKLVQLAGGKFERLYRLGIFQVYMHSMVIPITIFVLSGAIHPWDSFAGKRQSGVPGLGVIEGIGLTES